MLFSQSRFLSIAILLLSILHIGTLCSAEADVWIIESGQIDTERYFGETVSNGVIGILSSPTPFRTEQTIINGAYEEIVPGAPSCIVSSFDFLNLSFSVDGERIDRLEQVSGFRQRLDMRRAVFTTSFDIGDKVSVICHLRALRHLSYSALMEVAIEAKRPVTLSVKTAIAEPAPSRKLGSPPRMSEIETFRTAIHIRHKPTHPLCLFAAKANVGSGKLSVAAAQSFMFDEELGDAPNVTSEDDGLSFTRELSGGSNYQFAVVGSTLTSAHVTDPVNEAQRLTTFSAIQSTRELIAQHDLAWQELWHSDIIIEGDDETQRDVHSMLYHLYSFIREGTSYSIAPMGMSRGRTGYLGHVFWDAEVWMLPTLLALEPDLARSMLEYRYERLPAARRNAAAHGYKGAMFPWESAATGDEDTWSTALSGSLEQHVTADVGIAAWNFYRVTQDRKWLREKGFPLIKETADFWSSRVERNGPGKYDIRNVVAADEYAELVDNDAYTNAAARENLAAATSAAKLLNIAPDPEWEHVRENIPILRFPDGITREHASYNGEEIKQADVNLLAYPLEAITDPTTIRRDLTYYGNRIDDILGPAMTKSIFAILYQRLGMSDKALEVFKSGYKPNERPPFGAIAENATSENSYFVTGAGGLLQAMLYGFGGLEITDQGLVHKPKRLPAAWRSLTLTGIGPQKQDFTVSGRTKE